MSFFSWDLIGRTPRQFVGLGNYMTILIDDPNFYNSLRVTVIFVGAAVGIEFVLGFILALLINREFSGGRVISAFLVTPMMMTPVVAGLMWRMFYHPEFGVLNYVLHVFRVGDKPLEWIADPNLALWSILIVDIWQWTPFVFLIMLSGLRALPKEPFESAVVDGASSWQMFRYITVPLLQPAIVVAVLIRCIDAFRIFDKVFVLTMGGPGSTTEVLSLYTYLTGFRYLSTGYAAALSYILLIIIVVISTFFIRVVVRSK